jgi:hypothetical protein
MTGDPGARHGDTIATEHSAPAPARTAGQIRPQLGTHPIIIRLLAGAILLGTFVYQIPHVLNPDLAWLLTVAERLLQGARLGVDITELNPPASVLIYMPAAFLGLHTPVRPEYWVIAMVLAGCVGSASLAVRALGPALPGADQRARAWLVLLAVLAIGPLRNFAEREHIACLGLVPFVALAARRRLGDTPSLPLAIAAGLSGGLAMCIKPYFVAICALPLIWNAARRRSLRPLLGAECWAAAAVVIAYFGAAMATFPQYFREYPQIVALTYLPYRQPVGYMLTGGLVGFAGLAVPLIFVARGRDEADWRGAGVWLMAVAGGVASFVVQGKEFGYVRVPMVLFALIVAGLAPMVIDRAAGYGKAAWLMAGRGLALAGLAVALMLQPTAGENRAAEFIGPVRRLAPPHPAILVVSDASEIGQPLTRLLDGTWASGEGSQLLTAGALNRLEVGGMTAEQTALARRIIADAHARLRADITRRRPDVLMIDGERFHDPYDWLGWMRQDPATAIELDRHYRLAARQGLVDIWVRQAAPKP